MTETGHSSSRLGPSPTHVHHDRRRKLRCLPLLICLAVLLALLITAVILAFTVFRQRDPNTTLVSATVTGVSPRVTFPAIRVELNVTLDLDLLVKNPNYASFSHDAGKAQLYYSGAQVGEADVAPGRIPARGSTHVKARLTVDGGNLTAEAGSLLRDVVAGRVGFDTKTRIPGKVTLLGFIKRHAVATSDCHVEVGLPDLKVRSQECKLKTKL